MPQKPDKILRPGNVDLFYHFRLPNLADRKPEKEISIVLIDRNGILTRIVEYISVLIHNILNVKIRRNIMGACPEAYKRYFQHIGFARFKCFSEVTDRLLRADIGNFVPIEFYVHPFYNFLTVRGSECGIFDCYARLRRIHRQRHAFVILCFPICHVHTFEHGVVVVPGRPRIGFPVNPENDLVEQSCALPVG